MPSSITQLVIGMAVALGMAFVSVSVIGSAAALTAMVERAQAPTPEALGGRDGTAGAEGRLSDRQQLRRIFLDEPRDRLR